MNLLKASLYFLTVYLLLCAAAISQVCFPYLYQDSAWGKKLYLYQEEQRQVVDVLTLKMTTSWSQKDTVGPRETEHYFEKRIFPTKVILNEEDFQFLLQLAIHPEQQAKELYLSGILVWYSNWKIHNMRHYGYENQVNLFGPESADRVLAFEFPNLSSQESGYSDPQVISIDENDYTSVVASEGYDQSILFDLNTVFLDGTRVGGVPFNDLPFAFSKYYINLFESLSNRPERLNEMLHTDSPEGRSWIGISSVYQFDQKELVFGRYYYNTHPQWVYSRRGEGAFQAIAPIKLKGMAIQSTDFLLGGNHTRDPVEIELPDGMIWDQSWNIIEVVNRPNIGGVLLFLEHNKERGDDWYVSPWLGEILDLGNGTVYVEEADDRWTIVESSYFINFYKNNSTTKVEEMVDYFPDSLSQHVAAGFFQVPESGYFFFSEKENKPIWCSPRSYPYYWVIGGTGWGYKRVKPLPQVPDPIEVEWVANIIELPARETYDSEDPGKFPAKWISLNGLEVMKLDRGWVESPWFGRFYMGENNGWICHEKLYERYRKNFYICPSENAENGLFLVDDSLDLYWTSEESYPEVWHYRRNEWVHISIQYQYPYNITNVNY